jgi:hypothetical protein
MVEGYVLFSWFLEWQKLAQAGFDASENCLSRKAGFGRYQHMFAAFCATQVLERNEELNGLVNV